MNGLILDLFAGPGGWDEGAARLGIKTVGIEWDRAACHTAVAAGHPRIQADVSRYPTGHLRGKVEGLVISAPCTTFSAAGKGAGKSVMTVLANGLRATLAGRNVVAASRTEATRLIKAAAMLSMPKATRAERSAWARRQAFISCLTLEIARWVRDCEPEWFACENVRGIAPLFELLAHEFRRFGYSTWTGDLNAADYGVPQTRIRRILTGSKVRAMHAPPPTHCQNPDPFDLFGGLEKWVSMADALGWGATDIPMPTVTAGGTASGGPEPLARGGRAAVERERERGRWVAAGSGSRHD